MTFPATAPNLLVESHGAVAIVTLSRPPVNAFTRSMYAELERLLTSLAADNSAKVIVLTGAGRVFSGGEELAERRELTEVDRRERINYVVDSMGALERIPIPVISAINGAVAGGGLCVASMSDYRIAADSAIFTMPEIKIGAVGAGGAFQRLLNVPEGAIRLMLYSGGRFTAGEAMAWRLVDEVVPSNRLRTRALAVAELIAEQPREMLVLVKQAILAASPERDWRQAALATLEFSLAAGRLGLR